MEAIALILTKFSEEVIGAQLALLLFTSAVAIYWLLIKKKKKESAEWVPAALVRAYLDRMQADERETRLKLFGEHSPAATTTSYSAPLASALGSTITGMDPALLKELEALRAQLSLSDQRAMEFDRNMNGIRAEKAALEQKLKDALAAATAAPGAAAPAAADPAMKKELEDLRARLQEYEVIEDDLANLKKFQKENEQLRQKIEGYEKGGATSTVVSGSPAPAEMKTVISGSPTAAPAMTLVTGGAASAAPASAPADVNTNVLSPATPAAAVPAPAPAATAAPAGPEKSSQQKEEELLSEFEKMLAS